MAGKTGLTVNGPGIGNPKPMTIGSTTSSGFSRKHNDYGFPVERNVTEPTIGRPSSKAEIQASDQNGTNSDRLQRTFTVWGPCAVSLPKMGLHNPGLLKVRVPT